MLIAYLSLTGNIHKFIEDAGIEKSVRIDYSNPCSEVNEDYILIMPSYNDDITRKVSQFIDYKNNLEHLVAVVGSGNTNFGEDGYCFNAVEISQKYDKPLIFKFEFSGNENDIMNFKKEVEKVEIARTKQKD